MATVAPTSVRTTPPRQTAATTTTAATASTSIKRDLKSWWKSFILATRHQEPAEAKPPGIFGVPLRQSVPYANVAISLLDDKGVSYIYGYIPIVVAKCGVYLKETATDVEGIFRLSGSEKRIKELKVAFDCPDHYGKGLDWDGYTVHDAANLLRRYLNDLPEPVVPLDFYEKFRDPLRGATLQAVGDAEVFQITDSFDGKAAIETYQRIIKELPPLSRQLLLYLLDLLAVFAARSEENRMTSQNLSAIFQPGILSHPSHAMAPREYRLNQCVLIFLIENQDHFLLGMAGTAADEKTKQEVESRTSTGPPTPDPGRVMTLARSSSAASAGATSVRKDGQIRRNQSVASRNSRHEGNSTPKSPLQSTTPPNGSGALSRSNTVPSKRSPALIGGKAFRRDTNDRHSSVHIAPLTPIHQLPSHPETQIPPSSPGTVDTVTKPLGPASLTATTEVTTTAATAPVTTARAPEEGGAVQGDDGGGEGGEEEGKGGGGAGGGETQGESKAEGEDEEGEGDQPQQRVLQVPVVATPPSKERTLHNLFQRSPHDGSDKRPSNKLRKIKSRRMGGK